MFTVMSLRLIHNAVLIRLACFLIHTRAPCDSDMYDFVTRIILTRMLRALIGISLFSPVRGFIPLSQCRRQRKQKYPKSIQHRPPKRQYAYQYVLLPKRVVGRPDKQMKSSRRYNPTTRNQPFFGITSNHDSPFDPRSTTIDRPKTPKKMTRFLPAQRR
jgi:hypothetical protein